MQRLTGMLLALTVVAVLAGWGGDAHAKRVALVIGNSDFTSAADLRNPVNDAEDVARRLDELGFEIAGGGALLNLTRGQMINAFAEFAGSLQSGDLAVVFFAGHGAQHRGENFLIPVDDKGLRHAEDLPAIGYSADALLRQLSSAKNVTNVIMLDACRNNALPESEIKFAPPAGLAQMATPEASFNLVMFAAASGSTASDGAGRNSPFTAALLSALEEPQRDLMEIVHDVRRTVRESTGGMQVPWSNSSLEGDVYLVPPPEVAPIAAAEDPTRPPGWQTEAFALYSALTEAEPQARLHALRDVLIQFPAGASTTVVRELIADLEQRLERREG